MEVIYTENLIKKYQNGVQALDCLSLRVQAGEIFSLLGQNGAGKSTLINILTTYLRPTCGIARMFGKDLDREAAAIRPKIACAAQKNSIDQFLSLTENMMFQSRLYQIPRVKAKQRMEHLIACFGLDPYRKRPVSTYSGGILRRLDIALHMMSNPQILFLDEPTAGMDIQSRNAMWEMLRIIREEFGTTIFLTTHYLEEADHLSDTICIMKDGKAAAQGTPDSLRRYLRLNILKISFPDKELARINLRQISEIFPDREAEIKEEAVMIPVKNSREDLLLTGRFLLNQQIAFTGLELMRPAIDDIFIYLTSSEEDLA